VRSAAGNAATSGASISPRRVAAKSFGLPSIADMSVPAKSSSFVMGGGVCMCVLCVLGGISYNLVRRFPSGHTPANAAEQLYLLPFCTPCIFRGQGFAANLPGVSGKSIKPSAVRGGCCCNAIAGRLTTRKVANRQRWTKGSQRNPKAFRVSEKRPICANIPYRNQPSIRGPIEGSSYD
jgi:hypothetical protein